MRSLCRVLVLCLALAPLHSVRAEMIAPAVPLTEDEATPIESRAEAPAGGNAAFAMVAILFFLYFVFSQSMEGK